MTKYNIKKKINNNDTEISSDINKYKYIYKKCDKKNNKCMNRTSKIYNNLYLCSKNKVNLTSHIYIDKLNL